MGSGDVREHREPTRLENLVRHQDVPCPNNEAGDRTTTGALHQGSVPPGVSIAAILAFTAGLGNAGAASGAGLLRQIRMAKKANRLRADVEQLWRAPSAYRPVVRGIDRDQPLPPMPPIVAMEALAKYAKRLGATSGDSAILAAELLYEIDTFRSYQQAFDIVSDRVANGTLRTITGAAMRAVISIDAVAHILEAVASAARYEAYCEYVLGTGESGIAKGAESASMGLFRKKKGIMHGFDPLPQGFDRRRIADGLAAAFERPMSERNAFANAALAAAEAYGYDEFVRTRFAIFQTEFAVNARDAVTRFPDQSTELAVAKGMGLFFDMTRDLTGNRNGSEAEMYETYGPHIPQILDGLHQDLMDATAQRRRT